MNLILKRRYALVTGGSHGIGKAIALGLASEGCNVAICARGDENLKSASVEIKSKNVDVITVKADVMNPDDIGKVVETVVKTWGTLHILVNNVGGGGRWGSEIPEETEQKVWQDVYSKNTLATVQFTMGVLPYMLKQKWGRVVTVSSIFGYEGGGRPWFNMAKSAEISLMKCLSLMPRYATVNITFNTVAPGFVMIPDTGWERVKDERPKEYQEALNQLPRGRFGTPEEVANLVVFLCSERASLINGVAVRADGGQSRSF